MGQANNYSINLRNVFRLSYTNAIRNYPIQPYQNESQFYPFPRRMAWSVRNKI